MKNDLDYLLDAIRYWIDAGEGDLAMSFYGLPDGVSWDARDWTLDLFACVFALVRANRAVRVLETGTAQGLSAAVFAMAVGRQEGARVVTIDRGHDPRRDDLWARLPRMVDWCIHPRRGDALEEMEKAWRAGERYDVVFLDSTHTQAQVAAELAWAKRLLNVGGLILVHDCLVPGVDRALRGENVIRLWTQNGADAGLGLAVVQ